jgi:hypothetical protein
MMFATTAGQRLRDHNGCGKAFHFAHSGLAGLAKYILGPARVTQCEGQSRGGCD